MAFKVQTHQGLGRYWGMTVFIFNIWYNVHVSCSAMSQTIANAGFYMVI